MDFIVEQTNKSNKRWGKPPVNAETVQPKPTVRKNRTVQPANTPTPKPAHVAELPVCAKTATTEKTTTPAYHSNNSFHPLRTQFKQLVEAYPFGKSKFNQVSDFEQYRKVIEESHTTHEQLMAGAIAYDKYVSSQGTKSSYVLNGGSWLAKGEWSKEYLLDEKPKQTINDKWASVYEQEKVKQENASRIKQNTIPSIIPPPPSTW